jgi:predicted molibdopterin-dependent oxidoreductase YjgC
MRAMRGVPRRVSGWRGGGVVLKFTITIDGKTIEAFDGESVAVAAIRAGLNVPRLCNPNGGHRAGCMVCAMLDKKSGAFVPSCALKVSDAMELESNSEHVKGFRKQSFELLLSEHIGDCTAPCRKACPFGFDIPRFLELLSAKKEDEASRMLKNSPPCEECAGLCQKVCRRKLVDASVKIKELIIKHRPEQYAVLEKAAKSVKYEHSFGKPSADDLKMFAGTSDDPNGCLRCHCKKDEDCRLRDLAQEFGITRVKALGLRVFERVSTNGVVYESGKCVLCGNCVDLGGLAMRGRAIVAKPDLPTGADWTSSLKKDHIYGCPTGAIADDKSVKEE